MQSQKVEANAQPAHRAGWSIKQWCPVVGIGRSSFYALPDSAKPHCTTIGNHIVIIEQPSDWLTRIAEVGGISLKRKPTDADHASRIAEVESMAHPERRRA